MELEFKNGSPSHDGPPPKPDEGIASTESLEDVISILAKNGCKNLTALIDQSACSGNPLAGGGFCDVYQGDLYTGIKIAIKCPRDYDRLKGDLDNQNTLKRTAREIYSWSKLNHPNVLPLLGFAVFRGRMSMISEWMENGNLRSYIRAKPDASRIELCIDVCSGLSYIHSSGMVHGDLKTSNVLVSPSGSAMIHDFGNSQRAEASPKFVNSTNRAFSVRWAAPELLVPDQYVPVNEKTDVYAYGMTALEVITGKVPYEGFSEMRVLGLVAVEHRIPPRPETDMTDDLWAMLVSCWSLDPSSRPQIADVKDQLQALYNGRGSQQTTNIIGSATSLEEIIQTLVKRGCPDLTSLIDLDSSSAFPFTGGGFADVYRGRLNNGTRIAIKSLRLYERPGVEDDEGRKLLKRTAREIYHWSKLNHPNVLPLMGLSIFRGRVSMISEYMENGNLSSFVGQRPDANRIGLCMDICEGLHHMHLNEVIHGDLKAANVLVSRNGKAMLAGFQNSKLGNLTLRFTATEDNYLSVRWAAPELILSDNGPQVSKEADVYAYGMTLLEIFTGKVPYEEFTDNRVLLLVAYHHKVPSRPQDYVSDKIWEILNLCWARNPSERPAITSIKDQLASEVKGVHE